MRASLKVSLTSCCLQPRGLRAYRTLHTSGGVLEGVWHSWRGHSAPQARSGVSACFSKLSSRMADERSVVPSLRNMALAIAVWPRTHV